MNLEMEIVMKWILFCLIIINIFSFFQMGFDKRRSRRHEWRVPEAHLFLSALAGGSVGSILGMRVFHHKTRHWYFVWGMPAILVLQIVLLYAVWRGWM